jgi:hypothetical protein
MRDRAGRASTGVVVQQANKVVGPRLGDQRLEAVVSCGGEGIEEESDLLADAEEQATSSENKQEAWPSGL